MKICAFDIETYADLFVFGAKVFDLESFTTIEKFALKSDENGDIGPDIVHKIEQTFSDADYIVSYNGSRFDLPILAKLKRDVDRMGGSTSKYVNYDAQLIIEKTDDGRPMKTCYVREWSAKHFDMLVNCLLDKSLKQWEMYCNLPIRELPYDPQAKLTAEMKKEIVDYCLNYDVEALSFIFDKFGSGKNKFKFNTVRAQKAILEMFPDNMVYKFDRTAQAISGCIIYGTNNPIPPKSSNPLDLFDLDMFDVPEEVKRIIKDLASGDYKRKAERMAYDYAVEHGCLRNGKPTKILIEEFEKKVCTFPIDADGNGIKYGKGGGHYIKKGPHGKLFCLDVQSEYPRVIDHFRLLKTDYAQDNWKQMMLKRFAMKALKGTPEYRPDEDDGRKLVLNSLSGGFRIANGFSVAFDPAAGEAMCYLGQLVITEMALAIPSEDLVEVNTDSIFFEGEHNLEVARAKADELLKKYEMLFEEEVMERTYFRDVNNYAIYDENGELIDGRGDDWKDYKIKGSEKAVSSELFRNLLNPEGKLTLDWSRYDWTDFIYKFHKAASSKYAMIGDKVMAHKNYYFLWTTGGCPDAQPIQFTNERIGKDGEIKVRYGVYAFDINDLEKYKGFIDYTQYKRDLDVAFGLWGREDLITTRLSKEQRKIMNRKKGGEYVFSLSQFAGLEV